MYTRNIIWPPNVREKLIQFRSPRFTPEETFDFITQLVLETEDLLNNEVLSKTYTEVFGEYKGISRIVVKKFRIYFSRNENEVIILAILFPGEY